MINEITNIITLSQLKMQISHCKLLSC